MPSNTDVTSYIELTIRALDVIGDLAGSANAETAADVLRVIAAIYKSVKEAHEEKVTPEVAREQIGKLLQALKSNDAAADAALAAKFNKA